MQVVFILNDYALHNQIVEKYCAARPQDSIALIKVPLVVRGKTRTETASAILPRLSKRFAWSKFLEFLVLSAITVLPKMLGRGAVFRRLSAIARRHGAPFHRTEDVMSELTLAWIAALNPDVVITLFHQIIRRKLIGIPRLGIVNIHPGILPDFRGIQPYFWELAQCSGNAGATLHFISDESIDTGLMLGMAKFNTWLGMSVQLNYYLTILSASYLLPQVMTLLEQGKLTPRSQDSSQGAYYRWPDSAAVNMLKNSGHRIVSWRDLRDILTGKYDQFEPSEIEIFRQV